MDRNIYAHMAALEDEHWWFVARRHILADVLAQRILFRPGAQLLEAGCGTGGNFAMLARFGEVSAFEPNAEARALARTKGDFDIRDGRLPGPIPFEPGRFDLVAAFDVLEHLDDDLSSLRAIRSLLRPGGWVVVTVPAFEFLWSRHDERHHHKRRYSRTQLLHQVSSAGFELTVMTYFNSLLFPLIAGIRLAKKMISFEDMNDDVMPARPLNRIFRATFASERYLLRRFPLPLGVSLLAIAKRSEA